MSKQAQHTLILWPYSIYWNISCFFAALIVYISLLEQQSKYGDALELLTGKFGSLIMTEVDRLRLQVLPAFFSLYSCGCWLSWLVPIQIIIDQFERERKSSFTFRGNCSPLGIWSNRKSATSNVWVRHVAGSNLAVGKCLVLKCRRVEGRPVIHQVSNCAPLALEISRLWPRPRVDWV